VKIAGIAPAARLFYRRQSMNSLFLAAAAIAVAHSAPKTETKAEICNRLEIRMAAAATDVPEIRTQVSAAHRQGAAMRTAADAIAATTGGFAGGLAAEVLRAEASEHVGRAEARQMAEIDQSSASLDALDDAWQRAGCE
jgi:hypothetical protein